MPIDSKNKFRVVSENSENIQTPEEFDNDEDRKLGFQPGQVIVSKKVNTALKQNSLIAVSLIDALMKNDSPTLSIDSTLEDLKAFFSNAFSNLQSTRKKQNRLFASASNIECEWNATYDIITLQATGTYTFTFGDINDNIKQSYECAITTQAANTVLSFPTGSTILQLNKFNATIGSPANTITLPNASTYIVEVVVINSQTYEVTILDFNGVIAHVIQQFTISLTTGNNIVSNNANNPSYSINLQNPNTVNVNYSMTGDDTKSGVANASTVTTVTGNLTSLKDSYTFNFAFTHEDYFDASQVATFNTSYTVDACSVTADGTDESNSRTITVTAPTLANSATYKVYYKIWWIDEAEPTDYTMIQTSPASVTRTNSTYSNRTVRVKQYVEMLLNNVLKATSQVLTNDFNIKGKEMPTLTAPTVDYRSRGYCGTGTLTINVTNPNSTTVNVYAKAGTGSYTNVGTITANSNANFTLTGVANSAGTVYAYLTATNYNNSATGNDSYPACICDHCDCNTAPCSCNTCNCVSDCVCECDDAPATVTMRITAYDRCSGAGVSKLCTGSATGDTSYASYSVDYSYGGNTCSGCSGCIAVQEGCPMEFTSVSWDSSITYQGCSYRRTSTSGGVGSTYATATYTKQ